MCTRLETVVTTTSMTAVSVSIRRLHSATRSPETTHSNSVTRAVSPSSPTEKNAIQESTALMTRRMLAIQPEPGLAIRRPKSPMKTALTAGSSTMAVYILAVPRPRAR